MHFAFFNILFLLPLFVSAIPLGLIPRDDANSLFGIEANKFALQIISYTIQQLDYILGLTLSEASSDDDDTQALFGVSAATQSLQSDIQNIIGVFNCSFPTDLFTSNPNGNQISPRDGMSYAHHFLSGLVIGGQAILANESLTLRDDTKSILARAVDMGQIIGDSVAASRFPGVGVSQAPPMAIEEYAASVAFAAGFPSCTNSQNVALPLPSISIFEMTMTLPFIIVAGSQFDQSNICPPGETCSGSCQIITQANGTSTTSVTPAAQCQFPETPGSVLYFMTNSATPLSTNPSDRVQDHDLESSIIFVQRFLVVPQSLA